MTPDDAHMPAGMKRSVWTGKDIFLHVHMERAALSKPKTDCREQGWSIGASSIIRDISRSLLGLPNIAKQSPSGGRL